MIESSLALKLPDAKQLANEIFETGTVAISSHAEDEMKKDSLRSPDVLNVVRGGTYLAPDLVRGEWRYKAQTGQMCVVFAFRSLTHLRVVTAWRIKS